MKITDFALDIVRLKAIERIYVHSDADGVAAGMILVNALRLRHGAVTVVRYGEQDDYPVQPNSIWCDITPSVNNAHEWAEAGGICLDHHATGVEPTRAFGRNGICWPEDADPKMSGASLAYVYGWVPLRGVDQQVRRFAHMVSIRDTWQADHKLFEESCVYHSAIYSFQWYSRGDVKGLFGRPFLTNDQIATGRKKHILRKHALMQALPTLINIDVPKRAEHYIVFHDPDKLVSDMAEHVRMLESPGLFLVGFREKAGHLAVSMRSVAPTLQVEPIASMFGGGGHPAAAAFRLEIEKGSTPDDWMKLVCSVFGAVADWDGLLETCCYTPVLTKKQDDKSGGNTQIVLNGVYDA